MDLINKLVALGVHRVVISPGSRSTPLTLAAIRHPHLRHWVLVDERSAAFFALGLSKVDRRPTAIIATSGTAPANWYPAVIEAYHAQLPLILLSADRPEELQNCGANQTIDQVKLFGSHVRDYVAMGPDINPDSLASLAAVVGKSLSPIPGPVHINIPLREPLVPEQPLPLPGNLAAEEIPLAVAEAPSVDQLTPLLAKLNNKRGIIVCGWGHYDRAFPRAIGHLAKHLYAPIVADPLSNLRFGCDECPTILSHYDGFLRNPVFTASHTPDWVLRFGAMPVSKPLQQYLQSLDTETFIHVDPLAQFLDPLHRCTDPVQADPSLFCKSLIQEIEATEPSSWMHDFLDAEIKAAKAIANFEPFFEGTLIPQLVHHLPDDSLIFSGNSMPIRDLDSFMGSGTVSISVYANRGSSGIDGNLSTFLGMAAAYHGKGKVVALVGDLSFFHDMNGLIAARDCNATIILLNNGGGGIFSYLPQAGLAEFEQAWLTPLDIDYAHAARLYQLGHQRVSSSQGFEEALERAFSQTGLNIIEVMIARNSSVQCHQQYWQGLAET